MWVLDSLIDWSWLLKISSKLLGLTLGWKLNVFSAGAPIHSLNSLKSATLALVAIILIFWSPFNYDMLLILLTMIYKVGPFSSPSIWRASMTNKPIFSNPFLAFHLLETTSQASGVATIMSFNNNTWVSFVSSLKVFPTLYWENIFESEWNLDFAKSSIGSIKIAFFPFATA